MTDMLARPGWAFFWWCLPLIIGVAGTLMGLAPSRTAAVWAVSLAWMGTGCVLNAIRCRRLHCYIAGPVFLLAAAAELLLAAGFAGFGPHAEHNIAGAALLLALLSFLPEFVQGRYVGR